MGRTLNLMSPRCTTYPCQVPPPPAFPPLVLVSFPPTARFAPSHETACGPDSLIPDNAPGRSTAWANPYLTMPTAKRPALRPAAYPFAGRLVLPRLRRRCTQYARSTTMFKARPPSDNSLEAAPTRRTALPAARLLAVLAALALAAALFGVLPVQGQTDTTPPAFVSTDANTEAVQSGNQNHSGIRRGGGRHG